MLATILELSFYMAFDFLDMFVFGNDAIDVAIRVEELHIGYTLLLIDSYDLYSPRGVPIEVLIDISPEALPGPDILLSHLYTIVAIMVRNNQLFQWCGASRHHNHILISKFWRV